MLARRAAGALARSVHREEETMGIPMDASVGLCGACGRPVRMGAVLYTADAQLVCPLCFTKADVTAGRRRVGFDGGGIALVGALATLVPFLSRAVGALMVASGAAGPHDWIALASGAIAAGCGGATIVAARARASGGWLALGAAVLVLGAYHVARGCGLVH
jgi:hypothetical protein